MNHFESYSHIKEWLESEIDEVTIKINASIHQDLEPLAVLLNTSHRKHPDLAIYSSNGRTLLIQLQVQSGPIYSTLKKLAIGLAGQLIWQRNNISTTIDTCYGYFLPSCNPKLEGSCVSRMKLKWDDKLFKFNATCEYIDEDNPQKVMSEFKRMLLSDLHAEKRKGEVGTSRNSFTLLISLTYIQQKWNPSAKQIPSGKSVVISDSRNKLIYKCPLNSTEFIQLTVLSKENLPDLCIKPTPSSHKRLFEYPLQKPSLKVDAPYLRQNLKEFMWSVKTAIESLHNFGRSHLDIRLDNICFNNDNQLVLIDLDRSSEFDEVKPRHLAAHFGKSILYVFPCHWDDTYTIKNVDWRQVGIMIYHIVKGSNHDYHVEEPTGADPFILYLVQEGKIVCSILTEITCDLFIL